MTQTQWEYCSIQYFGEQSSPQRSEQESEDASQGGERSFLDWLFEISPVRGKATQGGAYEVAYFFYRLHGLERHTIYEGDDLVKVDDETSKYVALLGMYGWEALHLIRLREGQEHWYFKRKVDPSNQYLTF